jgi:hypothetical protein
MLKVYIFSYAIIKELTIYYNINFFFFQERGIALGQPTAHLLITGTFALPKWCLEGIEPLI